MIAHARGDGWYVELGRFDDSTGKVSDIITINNGDTYIPYGCEFSPDSKVLYSYSTFLTQYDITGFPSAEAIESTGYSFGSINTTNWGARLASNGKIYIPYYTGTAISVIDNPNVLGIGCGFEEAAIAAPEVGIVRSSLGSKVVINMHYEQGTSISSVVCLGDTTLLYAPAGYSHYRWNDGTIGMSNSISEAGTYWVKYWSDCIITADTFHVTVVSPDDCITSMNQVRKSVNDWMAYPNPVRDGNLYIQRELSSDAEMILYDLSGKELYRRNISKKTELIDMSLLARGLYYLRIDSKYKPIVKL